MDTGYTHRSTEALTLKWIIGQELFPGDIKTSKSKCHAYLPSLEGPTSAEIWITNFSIWWRFRNSSGMTEKTFCLSRFTDNSFRHRNLSRLGKSWSRKQHTVFKLLIQFINQFIKHFHIFKWKPFIYPKTFSRNDIFEDTAMCGIYLDTCVCGETCTTLWIHKNKTSPQQVVLG